MIRVPRSALLAVAALLASGIARGGVVVQYQGDRGVSTFTAEGDKLRIEDAGKNGGLTLFDAGTQRLFRVDRRARTYQQLTEADAEALSADLEQRLASVPPEQRAALASRLGAPGASPPTFEPTGERETVAGHACERFRVLAGGTPTEEACLIPWASSPVARDDLRAFLALARFSTKLGAAATGGRAGSLRVATLVASGPGLAASLAPVDEHGHAGHPSRLVSVKHERVDPAAFRIPASYTHVESGPARRPRR